MAQVKTIADAYRLVKKHTGEDFNIFSVLRKENCEVSHSRIIAELLNPKGSHSQGVTFLKEFVKVVGDGISEFDIDDAAVVEVEKYIGDKTDSEGGRIDILIKDRHGRLIIIENKIWAGDQGKQLYRYNQYGKKSGEKCEILYLTLNGKDPSDYSLGVDNGIQFTNISYEVHITKWLESCHKETSSFPIIRETITQYLNLVKDLTNQGVNMNECEEIAKLVLQSEPNFDAFDKLLKSKDSVYRGLQGLFRNSVNEVVASIQQRRGVADNLECVFSGQNLFEKDSFFLITNKWQHEMGIHTYFGFDGPCMQNLGYGFKAASVSKMDVNSQALFNKKLTEKFIEQDNTCEENSPGYICVASWHEYRQREDKKIISSKFKEDFKAKLESLLAIKFDL